MKKYVFSIIFFFTCQGAVQAVSVNRAFLDRIIAENKYFIEYINPHISNFSTKEYEDLYRDAIEQDFNANVFYLSGEYRKAYEKILESQKQLRKLYYAILTERYEVDTKELLKMSTPIILLAKDKKAEYYLRQGYSNFAIGRDTRKYGFGVNHLMLSQKIKYYINAIDTLIKAKKYAIKALIESTIPLIDKEDYKGQTFDEAAKRVEKMEISDYEFLRNELVNNVAKKSFPDTYPFLLHHDDNYRNLGEGKQSLLNSLNGQINAKVKGFKNQSSGNNGGPGNGSTGNSNNSSNSPKGGNSGSNPGN